MLFVVWKDDFLHDRQTHLRGTRFLTRRRRCGPAQIGRRCCSETCCRPPEWNLPGGWSHSAAENSNTVTCKLTVGPNYGAAGGRNCGKIWSSFRLSSAIFDNSYVEYHAKNILMYHPELLFSCKTTNEKLPWFFGTSMLFNAVAKQCLWWGLNQCRIIYISWYISYIGCLSSVGDAFTAVWVLLFKLDKQIVIPAHLLSTYVHKLSPINL